MRHWLVLLPTCLVMACGGSEAESEPPDAGPEPAPQEAPPPDPTVAAGMKKLEKNLSKLLPYMASAKSFRSRDNRPEIKDLLEEFTDAIDHAAPVMAQNEEWTVTLAALEELIDDSRHAFADRRSERARIGLQWAVNLCVSCHSRLTRDMYINRNADELRPLSEDPFEAALLLVAFQQDEEARHLLDTLIVGYPDGLDPERLDRALQLVATLSIRRRESPAEILATFERIQKNGRLFPGPTKKYLKSWVKGLQAWVRENAKREGVQGGADPAALIAEAKTVLGKSAARLPSPRDRTGIIAALRASDLLHQALRAEPAGEQASTAEMLLGVCYASLDHYLFYGLDTMYLRGCVARNPDSANGKKCNRMLEQALARRHGSPTEGAMPAEAKKEMERFKKRTRGRGRR